MFSSDASRAHGGVHDAELEALGIEPRDVVDFSVNVNAYGPHPDVARAARDAAIDRYPDATAHAARSAMARALDVDRDRIVLAPGTVDLLWTLVRVVLAPGDTLLVVEPAFSEPARAAQPAGVRVEAWRAARERGFAVDVEALSAAVALADARCVYLSCPANPTGVAVAARDAADLARAHPAATFLVDQAFLSLSDRHDDARVRMPDNVVTLRSLTKDHALAGLRVGYAIAPRELAARIEAARPPWSTSAPAQAAAVAAVAQRAFVDECRARLFADRNALARDLRTLGLRVHPTSTIFFLVEVGDAARARRELLARHRVLVRDCASFGIPDCIRVCARPTADRARLVAALRGVLR